MPVALSDLEGDSPAATDLAFPPLTKAHIDHCAVPSWHTRYRSLTPKTRFIPLTCSFLEYLRSDGIVLPPDGDQPRSVDEEQDDGWEDDEDTAVATDPSQNWSQVHANVKATIEELGGRVYPKLNWSAPKDATWIAATNSMDCGNPNDIYLLLKSSDFITHDLQQAYIGCVDSDSSPSSIPYHLVLRKTIPSMITSMEFRCFVRNRRLLAICQRDLNHYDFLPSLLPILQDLIYDFFTDKLRTTFPDPDFVFDVYVPQPKERGRVWLIDINPWAPRTDPLLFSWLELLTMPEPAGPPEMVEGLDHVVVRLRIQADARLQDAQLAEEEHYVDSGYNTTTSGPEDEDEGEEDEDEEENAMPAHYPEFRLVKRDDPEAYSFNTPLYSAHKIPRDVVDASMTIEGQGGMREFMANWQERVAEIENGVGQESSDEE